MQIDHVIGMRVRDDHRVYPVRGRRAEQGQQAGQGPVPKIEDDPRAPVLQHEATARPPGLRPGPAAAEHHQPTGHADSLPPLSTCSPRHPHPPLPGDPYIRVALRMNGGCSRDTEHP